MHLGHQRLLRQVVWEAKRLKGISIVVTFHPHPSHVLSPQKELPLLISLKERLRLLQEAGVDICIVEKFSKKFSRLRAKDFINQYLIARLNPAKILVGSNFVFGGDQQSGWCFESKIKTMPPVRVSGEIVSSTLIRRLIRQGALAKAQKLLNRPLLATGKVVRGSGKGKEFGFPTANIRNYEGIRMPHGVYAVKVYRQKESFYGMAFIGLRPAFVTKSRSILLEVNIFDFCGNIRGQALSVEFLRKIRDEKNFTDVDSLIKQLTSDLKSARKLIRTIAPHW